MRVLKGHTGKLRAVAYSPDGSKLATAGDAGVTKLWDVASGRELATIRQPDAATARPDEKRVSHLAFSHDGRLLATGRSGVAGRVRVWAVATVSEVPFPAEPQEFSAPMAFTPDGASLILARGWGVYGQPRRFNSTVLAWNSRSGQVEGPFVETDVSPQAMAVSATADLLAVAYPSSVRLWGLTDRKPRGRLGLPPIPQSHLRATMEGLAFAPDGRALAVAAGARAFVFDLPDGRQRGASDAHTQQVASVAFAPNGRLLATAGHDGTVRLWDVDTLAERAAYNWELGKLRGVAFHPDGLTMAAVGEKSKVVIWDVEVD